MYDDRWLRFTNWATGQGFDPLGPTAAQIAAFLYDLFDTLVYHQASLKHLALKTIFLLAMATAGRRSELQALVFDPKYIQFKPKGADVPLYFIPEFMRKNQRPDQVNDPWYIPTVPTAKPDFGAPNCPVRALRYYHRFMTEHPELRKGR